MQVKPLHPLFAAEVIGLDTAAPITPEIVDAFERAMAQYAVCVIRDASLSAADHIRFSRAFGPLELPPGSRRNDRQGQGTDADGRDRNTGRRG